jgi:hypothetical protein
MVEKESDLVEDCDQVNMKMLFLPLPTRTINR